jgi:phage terminase large subunit-like protein
MLQLPSRYTHPLSEDFVSDGDRLIELVNIAWKSPENPNGLILDEWQKWLLRAILERYPADHPTLAGRLRYRQVVVSMGRQNGKSVLGAILGLYGLLMHETGAQVLSLASSVDQAEIIYNRVLYVIRNNNYLTKRFKRATETRGIVTADGGGRYMVKPAKESALQGIPVSLCLFDELHLAKKGMWTAAVLGTSTRSDGMVIGITTAGDETSETLIELYLSGDKAISGNDDLERFGFFVWEATANSPVLDKDAILAANPMIAAGRIPIEQVLSDLSTLPEHEARRYRLNQFISGASQSWVPGQFWANASGSGIKDVKNLVLAVEKTDRWEHATIAAAVKVGDAYETELVRTIVNPSEDALFDMIIDLDKRFRPAAIALDDYTLHNLGRRLKTQGITVWSLWGKEHAAACSFMYSALATGKVIHNNDPLLNQQVGRGVAHYTGDTWRISRKYSTGQVDALLATVLACYVASTQTGNRIQVF